MISLTGGKRAFSFRARIVGILWVRSRVADPGWLSRILIFVHPESRIPDLESRIQNSNKREGWKKFVVLTFFVATKITKLKIILILNCRRKNLSLSPQKYRFGLRGSEIGDPEKIYSGSRIQGSKRHRIPDPQHWCAVLNTWYVLFLTCFTVALVRHKIGCIVRGENPRVV